MTQELPINNENAFELYSILTIDNKPYKVTAVHSDAASKVDNKLVVNKVAFDGTISDENKTIFDGSTEQTISVVSSEGGAFTGPVAVKDLKDLALPEEKALQAVINLSDIKQMIQRLTGYPCYNWEYKEDKWILTENKIPDDIISIEKVMLVNGSYDGYREFISQEPKPVFFLYICTDTGQLFFGQDSNNYQQIGTSATKLVYENEELGSEGFTAADIEKTFKDYSDLIDEINDENEGILAKAKTYITETISNSNEAQFTEINSILGDGFSSDNTIASTIQKETNDRTIADENIRSLIGGSYTPNNTIHTAIDANAKEIRNVSAAVSTEVKERTIAISDIVDDYKAADTNITEKIGGNYSSTNTVHNAITTNAEEISKLRSELTDGTLIVQKASSATTAVKATNDSSGNTISSYYQKKITCSNISPTATNGVNGDIWIKYV